MDATATFGGTSGATIWTTTVNANRTIGHIYINSNRIHSIDSSGGSILTLDVTGGMATIGGNNAARQLRISADLAGGDGVEINSGATDNGVVILSGNNTYTGGTKLTAGTVQIGNANALSTGTITFNGGGIGSSDATAYTLSNSIELLNNVIIGKQNSGNLASGSGVLTFSDTSATALGASRTFTVDPGLSATFAQAFTGTGHGITKAGTGTLILSGANTYDGGTTVSAGSLVFRNLDAKSSSGTHAFGAGTTLGLGVGTGLFTSSDIDNAFAGNMVGNLSNVTVNATTKVGIDTTAGDFTYATDITTRGLAKFGANTLTVSGNNTYTGGTNVEGGTLRMGSATALGSTSGALTVNGNGTLDINGNNLTVGNFSGISSAAVVTNSVAGVKNLTVGTGNAAGNYAGSITGDIKLIKNGTGTLLLGNANTHTGGTTLNGGMIDNVRANSLGTGTITFGGNAELRAFRQTTDVWDNAVHIDTGVTGQINAINQFYRFSTTGVLSGDGTLWATATDNGNGSVIFSNTANTFTGSVQVGSTTKNGNLSISSLADSANSIKLGGTSGTGNLTFSGTAASQIYADRTVELTGTTGGGRINNSGSTANIVTFAQDLVITGTGNKTFTLGGSNTGNNAFNGAIGDGVGSVIALTKADSGKWILGGDNTYTGATTISAGNLEIGGSGTLGNTGAGVGTYAGNISIASSSSGRLTYNSTATQTISGVVSGAGALFVEAGTLELTNTNTYTGATTINGGSLLINGSTSTSAVTVATTGTLGGSGTVGGATTINGALKPGNSPGVLTFSSSLALAGTSTTTIGIDGMTRATGYDGVDVGTTLTLGGDLIFDIGAMLSSGTFDIFNFTSESGDFANVSLAGVMGTGSFTFDSSDIWSLDNGTETWSFTQSTGDLSLTVIPEPSAALLGALGILLLLRRRRA